MKAWPWVAGLALLCCTVSAAASTNAPSSLRRRADGVQQAQPSTPVSEPWKAEMVVGEGGTLEAACHCEGGGGDEGDPEKIFLARQLDPVKVGVFMVVLIAFTLGLELLMERLPMGMDETSRAMLDKVYRELALLGLLSFFIFIVQVISRRNGVGEKPWIPCFEYAHMLLFFIAVIYVAQAAIMVASIRPMRRHLEKLNDRSRGDDQQVHASTTAATTPRNQVPPPQSTAAGSSMHSEATSSDQHLGERYLAFGLFRAHFIAQHRLPPPFLFDRYLSYCYKLFVRHSLEISPLSWLVVIAICSVDLIISYARPGHFYTNSFLRPLPFMLFGLFILLLEGCLFWAVYRAHWEMRRYLCLAEEEAVEHVPAGFKTLVDVSRHETRQEHSSHTYRVPSPTSRLPTMVEGGNEEGGDSDAIPHRQPSLRGPTSSGGSRAPPPPTSRTTSFLSRLLHRTESINHGGQLGDTNPSALSLVEVIKNKRLSMRQGSWSNDLTDDLFTRVMENDAQHATQRCGLLEHWWRRVALTLVLCQPAVFRFLQDAAAVTRCLYLAAFFTTDIFMATKMENGVAAAFIIIITPLAPLLCLLVLSPLMITKYLLVKSTVWMDQEALDSVIDYMECVEGVFVRLQARMAEQQAKLGDSFLDRTFTIFDTNKDGQLSQEEFRRGLRAWGIHLTNREMHALLRFVDEDGDQSISLSEFSRLVLGTRIFALAAKQPPGPSSVLEAPSSVVVGTSYDAASRQEAKAPHDLDLSSGARGSPSSPPPSSAQELSLAHQAGWPPSQLTARRYSSREVVEVMRSQNDDEAARNMARLASLDLVDEARREVAESLWSHRFGSAASYSSR